MRDVKAPVVRFGVWSWLLFPTGIAPLRVEVEMRAMAGLLVWDQGLHCSNEGDTAERPRTQSLAPNCLRLEF